MATSIRNHDRLHRGHSDRDAQRKLQIKQDEDFARRLMQKEVLGRSTTTSAPHDRSRQSDATLVGPSRLTTTNIAAHNRRSAQDALLKAGPSRMPTATRHHHGQPQWNNGPTSSSARGTPASDQRSTSATRRQPKGPECQICAEAKAANQSIRTACGHVMCADCIQISIGNAIKDRSTFPPRCCPVDQQGEIKLATVKHLIPADLARTFEQRAVEYKTPNATYCHIPGCEAFIPQDRVRMNVSVGTCPQCRAETCTRCKRAEHLGRDCLRDENQQIFEQVAQRRGWKRCPRCGVMVERVEGCSHMTCTICLHNFCYKCGGTYGRCHCDARGWDDMFPPNHEIWNMEPRDQARFADELFGRPMGSLVRNAGGTGGFRVMNGIDDSETESDGDGVHARHGFPNTHPFFEPLHEEQERQRSHGNAHLPATNHGWDGHRRHHHHHHHRHSRPDDHHHRPRHHHCGGHRSHHRRDHDHDEDDEFEVRMREIGRHLNHVQRGFGRGWQYRSPGGNDMFGM